MPVDAVTKTCSKDEHAGETPVAFATCRLKLLP
jgi:hypothetical protein